MEQVVIRWFYIDIHYATFAISAKDNIVSDVAPIVNWMRGKTLQDIKPWLIKKKAKVIEICKKD